jgi:hypothetical protein
LNLESKKHSSFFQLIVKQLVAAIEEHQEEMRLQSMTLEDASADGLFTFSGEVIVKLCRRGHAGWCNFLLTKLVFTSYSCKEGGEKASIAWLSMQQHWSFNCRVETCKVQD